MKFDCTHVLYNSHWCLLLFPGILNSAQASLDDAVTLKECDSIDLTRISSPNDYIAAASSTETLEQIEEVVTAWIKQIEQVQNKNCLMSVCQSDTDLVSIYMLYAIVLYISFNLLA